MKKLLLLTPFFALSTLACGPFFPPSYISDVQSSSFIERINIPMELMLLAREYNLIDTTSFPTSSLSNTEADLADFTQRANILDLETFIPAYTTYARQIRTAPAENTERPELPKELREFSLYLEGIHELKQSPDTLEPAAWIELLTLPEADRRFRTTWVHYMLGNLATGHGEPAAASRHYAACRQAARTGMTDSISLAGASYKREFLAQTNTADRIRCGVQAIGYYQQSGETNKMIHCLEHLEKDFSETDALTEAHLGTPLNLETSALFCIRSDDPRSETISEHLKNSPPLKTAPRLAWFLYKRGEIKRASDFLKTCPDSDPLANWLRFRIAQRNGDPTTAIDCLRRWLTEIRNSDRVIFGFRPSYTWPGPRADIHGILGHLLVTQGDMQDALIAFVQAGSYPDAALIAERYLYTNTLKNYIDTLNLPPPESHQERCYYSRNDFEVSQEIVNRNLTYLLARRLFREGRSREALPYYPKDIAAIVQTYQTARTQAENNALSRNQRSAHLFHAARILRWKGMEMCGTAHAPDYTIVSGNYPHGGITCERLTTTGKLTALYKETTPAPDLRFHYRYLAAELADQAASLARSRHQRATILWCAGEWLQKKTTQRPPTSTINSSQTFNLRRSPQRRTNIAGSHDHPTP